MTSTPEIVPITAAAHGDTKAQGAVMATRPASRPLAIMPGSGLPVRFVIHSMAMKAPKTPAMAVLVATTANCTSVPAKVDAALKPNQPEQQDERAEQRHRDVVAGDGPRRAVLGELADAGSEHDRTGQRGGAAHGVDDTGPGEVDIAVAEVEAAARAWRASRRPRSTR